MQQEFRLMGAVAEVTELMRRRRLPEAEKRLRVLAAREPRNPEIMALQGALAAERGKPAMAMGFFAKSLTLGASPTVHRRSLHALLSLAIAHDQVDLAKNALRPPIPKSDAGATLAPADLGIVLSLANQCGILGKNNKGIVLLTKFWPQIKNDPRALELFGALKLAADQPQEALEALKKARSLTTPKPGLLIALGAAAHAVGETETVNAATQDYIQLFPAFVAETRPNQVMTLGVANWHHKQNTKLTNVLDVHFGGNFVSQVAHRHADTYRIVSVLLNSANALKAISDSPRPDIVYNSVVNPEVILRHGYISRLLTLIGIWDRPVINHPDNVLKTTRQASANLYSSIDGLVVPKVREFVPEPDTAELVKHIEGEFRYPVIVRGMTEQQGKNAFLVENRTELEHALSELKEQPRFYVIEFFESRHEEGLFRKIRASVAGDFIQIVRVDHDMNWNVHGRKDEAKVRFYDTRRHLLEGELAACMDPDAHLGPQVMPTLRALRERNPLDVFGIDFDVMPDGRILFFEANAAMNLASSADPRVDYPEQPEAAFMAAFVDYTKRLKETAVRAQRA
jgi:Flp pilus assembly protein TadD